MSPRSRWSAVCLLLVACLSLPTFVLAQGTSGRILGRVADPTGAVLGGVKVTLVNAGTNVSRDTTTNANGDYDFVEVPVGSYRLEFDLKGFKKNVRRDIALDINQVVTLNMTMQPGGAQEVVDVTSEAPLVETTSTQLGAVVGERSVTELPLNSRDTYQFLQLQPGVMSTAGSSNSIVYGSNNAGAVSVNGGRGRSNNFSVNGGDANDQFVNLPTVQPSPDSIAEFRVLTNTFDAEYGRNSGSVVNVVTKSGTNQLHGNVYEFFRNKVLNANAYCFSADGCPKPQFNQNQFGGTLGGPIVKDHTFFFVSYEGRRIRQGIQSPAVTVPTDAERPSATQNFADFSADGPLGGSMTDDNVATTMNNNPACVSALGGPVTLPSDPQYQGSEPWSVIFPSSIIPLACMDPTAVNLLKYVPTSASGLLVTVPVQPDRGDQFTIKLDHRINDKQNLSFYYYFDDHSLVSPFAQFQAAGANVPGFASATKERFQQWNISHTWTINNSTVNEFRFNYNREAQRTFQHPTNTSAVQDSCGAAPSWLTSVFTTVPCFSDNTPGNPFGIHPGLGAQHEGLPFIQLSGGFTIGNNGEGELPQVGNSFQWSDSISKVMGAHSFKFGADVRRQRFDQTLYFDVSGEYFFDGSSTNSITTSSGSEIPDFLMGLPGSYGQGSAQVENVRSTGLYLFAQDSWKIKPNVTLNYGLRWELTTPIADISKHVQTFRPGQNTTIYPCQLSQASIDSLGTSDCTSVFPTGLLVPGDPGVPNGMTQTYYKAFAPRIGIAWSPGTSGKTSIRAGWGMFYNPIEQLVLEQFSAEPPFGGSTFPVQTQFNLPFLGQDGSTVYPNPFNGILNPPRKQALDWSIFRPILLFGQFQPKMRSQYSDQYNLTIQHELTKDTKVQIGYVGSQGHRLLATHDINYGNPQTCLDLQAISDYYANLNDPLAGTYACGQYYSDSGFGLPANTVPAGFSIHLPNGQVVTGPNAQSIGLVGLRRYSSPNCNPVGGWDDANQVWTNGCPPDGIPVFSSIFAQDTIANSAYNSLQASFDKRFSQGLQLTAAYTFSKSFDEASSFEGILNPIDPRRSRSLSSFDARHRIVLSYYYELPFRKYTGVAGQIVNGWALSGITTFQTGFPIRITSQADNELMYSFDFELPGEPNQIAPFHTTKPQKTCFSGLCNYAFDPNSFTENASTPNVPGDPTTPPNCSDQKVFGCYDPTLFGSMGTAPRTICCGPHISNTDFAILKTFSISETKRVDFRAEFFNIFNHSQFFNPDGNTSDGTQFGQVIQARDPRLMQFALKFFF